MKNVRLASGSIVGCTVVALALVAGNAEAQKTKGKTRAALTKQLMKGFVAANCGDLGKLLKAEQLNWEDVALKAALLNEAGYVLMDDGRCPDGDWANAAKAIQGASVEVLAAAEKKDLEAANAAFKKLTTDGCAACHKVHKPK
jgi:cytochrome c556